ncbi:IclR family transcriptional regulator [Nocardioides massiliensis]|uniref:DNA-binding IclR family transcriptional regulator n=1 Tax=Nocardioides massiliensis TaxID=1325935 RepID=A0ABT9NND9_9ACTN|nr:IclR family transcriptional regulator [Nocardioides massiliensis]MDP9821934.1 DNA-binding IclR family transcriptional regulator [Nocardioides massiliensis]
MSVGPVEARERPTIPPSMVERMTLILDAFPGRTTRLTLEEVARATHLPRSTAHRILDQLLKLGWLQHAGFGYCLGPRALQLAGAAGDTSELRAVAAPHLHDLMLRTGLTVHLAVLDEGCVHYLDKLGSRTAVTVPSRVGGYAPAHCTALGRAMLAWLPAEEVDELVGDDLRAMTTSTVSDLASLHRELHRVRVRHGLAVERGECYDDIACVAAAVHAPEGPIGAISVVGDSTTAYERVAPLVLDAARQVSRELYPDLEHRRGRVLRSV